MSERGDGLESERLNEGAAQRLIRRATELDASLASESSVADLRAAAREAGISDEAFQRALDEVRTPAPSSSSRFGTFAPRRFLIVSAVAMLIGALMAIVAARGGNSGPDYDAPGAVPSAAPATPAVPPRPPTPPR